LRSIYKKCDILYLNWLETRFFCNVPINLWKRIRLSLLKPSESYEPSAFLELSKLPSELLKNNKSFFPSGGEILVLDHRCK